MHLPDPWILAAMAALALLLAGALSPLEALGWWAGWYGRRPEDQVVAPPRDQGSPPRRFVVFLSGIHSVEERAFARREVVMLERLRDRISDACNPG